MTEIGQVVDSATRKKQDSEDLHDSRGVYQSLSLQLTDFDVEIERICRGTQFDEEHFALMVFDPDTLEPVEVSSLGSVSDFAAASVSQSQSGKHEDAYGLELGCQTHTQETHTHMGAHTHLTTHTVATAYTHNTHTPVKM
jgi:hypothetical protein